MKILLALLLLAIIPQNNNFLKNQLKHARVRTAKAQKDSIVKNLFVSKGINYPSNKLFIRIFKSEALLEVWAYDKKIGNYILIKKYDICALSGKLGPKRRRGDLQVPEGIYYISLFNPVSNFYLSLKLNYPNKSDRILGYKKSLGGDIFIHGDCVTIGCVPITDDCIKEVYWMTVQAKSKGQDKIPVYIFPMKLENDKFAYLENIYSDNRDLLDFWSNLKTAFDYFEKYKLLPEIEIDNKGKYNIKKND